MPVRTRSEPLSRPGDALQAPALRGRHRTRRPRSLSRPLPPHVTFTSFPRELCHARSPHGRGAARVRARPAEGRTPRPSRRFGEPAHGAGTGQAPPVRGGADRPRGARRVLHLPRLPVFPPQLPGGDFAGARRRTTTSSTAARADHGVELAWCFDIPGEKGIVAGRETVVFALRERPEGLVSFGLGGREVTRQQRHRPGRRGSPRALRARRRLRRRAPLSGRRPTETFCRAPPSTASTSRSPKRWA